MGAELLLLRHPHAGIQLPAGTVDLGEVPLEAAYRELAEETGISACELVATFTPIATTLGENERVILRMTKLFDSPANDASSAGYGLTRGSLVEVAEIHGSFSLVKCDALDWTGPKPVRKPGVLGYVRTSLLGQEVVRHLYHFTTDEETPAKWQTISDGVAFSPFWASLVPQPVITTSQRSWLYGVYVKLVEYYRDLYGYN